MLAKPLRNSFNTISLLVCESLSDGGMIVVSNGKIAEHLALFSDGGMIVVFGNIVVSCFALESCLI
jgi:c-di-GMP-binding flagellar brake protein YcgR